MISLKSELEQCGAIFYMNRGRPAGRRVCAVPSRLKNWAGLNAIPCKRLAANQVFTLCAMMAHKLSREIQMITRPATRRAGAKRPAVWQFSRLDSIRHRIVQRAGRLTRPEGKLTLTMSANQAVRHDLLALLDVMQKAA